MFCTNCGNKLTDNALFCHVCGTPVGGKEPQPSPAEGVPSAVPQFVPAEAANAQPQPAPAETPAEEVAEVKPQPAPAETPAEEVFEVKPQPAPAETPAEEVAEVKPQPAPADEVADVTLIANKWLPDDAMLPQEEHEPEKKSKKGLIITLCAVAFVLCAVVLSAFLISGSYSGKVREFETYRESNLINDMADDYFDLLDRARKSEGVLHVFETFSLRGEINDFLERIELYKKELPGKALKEQQDLENLGQKYYTADWEEQIKNNGLKIRSLIDEENYESLFGMIREDATLKNEIIDKNNALKDDLSSILTELKDIRTKLPAYGLYRKDVDNFIEQAGLAVNTGEYTVVPGYVNKGTFLIESIKEANRPYKDACDRKEYYDALFEDVEIIDRDRYDKILLDFTNALAGPSDVTRVNEIVSEYATLYEETHEANLEEYLILRDKIDAFDLGQLTSEEYTAFNDAYSRMRGGEAQDKLSVSLPAARECMAYVEKYTRQINESEVFLELVSALPVLEVLFGEYTGELSEEEVYYICEYMLSDEQIEQMREKLGWGAQNPDGTETPGWRCGFSRSECEELAYYITGNRHYFYKEISSYATDSPEYADADCVRKSDFDVYELEEGMIGLEYSVQIMVDGQLYNAVIQALVASNEDSFFDNYSVLEMSVADVEDVNYEEVFLKALKELYDAEPDKYGDDISYSRHMSLVYIDEDHIPELYVSLVPGTDSSYIVTYVDNDNYRINILERTAGFCEYIEDEGVIRIHCKHGGYGTTDYYYDIVMGIAMDGSLEELFTGKYCYVDGTDYNEVIYSISCPEESDDVDEQVYYGYLDEYYSSKGESRYLTADYTYEEMTTLLTEED